MMTRSKSLPIRSSRKSLDLYLSPASFPEEANQREAGSGVSNKRYAPQIESSDADVEIVTATFFDGRDVPPHKKRHCLETSETDRAFNLDACIVCEISDELVSRCSGTDCLLWFHGECLNAEFTGSCGANSYCPYCWFKILAMKSIRLKEKAFGAEMAVFKYLDKEMESKSILKGQGGTTDIVSDQDLGENSSKEKQVQVYEKESDESGMELTEENDHQADNFEVHTDKPEQDMKVVDEVEGSSNDEERAGTEEFQDAEHDEAAVDKTKANAVAGKEGDVSQFLSMQESFSGKEHDQVQQNEKRPRKRRRLILNAFDSDVSSNGSTNKPNGEDAAEQMTSLALVVTSPSGRMKNQQREHNTTTKTVRMCRDISFFKKDQKRRLLWTPEEEYMLKVGVEKFSAEAKKNMPWRKILEMGRKVFHETRTPADLKDKWRNMTGARLGKKNKQDTTTIPGM